MALEIGYGNLYFFKFADSSFTKNAFPEFILQHADKVRADDNIKDKIQKTTKTVVLSGGDKIVITQPNEDSASLGVTVLAPLDPSLQDLAFVDSVVVINGSKERRDFFDRIGIELSDWQNSFYFEFHPTDAAGNEVSANEWISYSRAVLVPVQDSERGKDEAAIELTIQSIGGTQPGSVASHTTDIDFTGGIDLSVGLPSAVNITLDQQLIENINLGAAAATTRLDIQNIVNNAFGKIVASDNDAGGLEFIDINARLASSIFGNLLIEPPTDLVTYQSGVVSVFNTGGNVSTLGTDPVQLPIKSIGDPTA